MFSNIRESSRARFLGSLYLGRSFSGAPLQHLTQIRKHSSRDRVKLLVNHTRDLLFFPVCLLLLLLLLFFIIIR